MRAIPSIRVSPGAWLTLAVAASLSVIAFYGGGGLQLGPTTTVEMALTLGAGAVACVALAAGGGGRAWGVGGGLLLFALGAYTGVSAIWSVSPSNSWVEGGRTMAYAATFAMAVGLVRLAPRRWRSLLGGILLASLVVSSYAAITKVFPSISVDPVYYARLRAPFGYWNAVGLTAALGVPAALWLGAQRTGHAVVRALAAPSITILLTTLMLSYSRGALLALAIGCALWFAMVPLRLRGLTMFALGGAGAAIVIGWTFAQQALTNDKALLAARVSAGHRLGLLLAGVVVVVFVLALAIGFATALRAPPARLRRIAGTAAIIGLLLVPVAGAVALTRTSRGLTGSISHTWHTLTDPNAAMPSNDPSRLTAVGSVRARYWANALSIWQKHPALGAGAGGYQVALTQVRTDLFDPPQAHGYVVQTLAELGLVGLVINLLIAAAWLFSAIRSANPFGWRRRRAPYTPERVGLLTMCSIVGVFVIHSLIDWTWYTPVDACVALLCAGWVAGRGPLEEHLRVRRPTAAQLRQAPWRIVAIVAAAAVALTVAWSQWEPLRSADAGNAALIALGNHDLVTARADALTAISRNPLDTAPLYDLSEIDSARGDLRGAQQALDDAVRLTPSDAQAYEALAAFELTQLHDRAAALRDLSAALHLDPRSYSAISQYLQTLQS